MAIMREGKGISWPENVGSPARRCTRRGRSPRPGATPARCNCGGGFPAPSPGCGASPPLPRSPARRASAAPGRERRSRRCRATTRPPPADRAAVAFMPSLPAHAEQVRATRRLCPAVAACLHCKAANRLPATPRRSCTSRVSGGWPAVAGHCSLVAVMLSSWASSVPNSDIHCSAGAATGGLLGWDTVSNDGVWLMDDDSARAGTAKTLPLSNLGHAESCAKIAARRSPALYPLSSMVFARNDIATRCVSEANSLDRPRLPFALTIGA